MKDSSVKRREAFAWQTKQELYDYFEGMYQIERSLIDREIEDVLRIFKIRKGRPINPQELWEKVGSNLEKQHTGKKKAAAQKEAEE